MDKHIVFFSLLIVCVVCASTPQEEEEYEIIPFVLTNMDSYPFMRFHVAKEPLHESQFGFNMTDFFIKYISLKCCEDLEMVSSVYHLDSFITFFENGTFTSKHTIIHQ